MRFPMIRLSSRRVTSNISVSSAVHTAEFFDGRAGLYAFRVSEGSPMTGDTLRRINQRYPRLTALIAFVERSGTGLVPFGETQLKAGDLCFIVTLRGQVHQLEELFRRERTGQLRRVIIVGGGKIGFQVARRLELRYRDLDIRLIDQDSEKCDKLARELERTIVLFGDGADEELLLYEGVEGADGFVTTTASDERNLLMGVIGRVHGARKSIAVVRRKPLMKLGDYVPVDALVNPNQALASLIMRHVRYPSSSGALSIIEKIDAEFPGPGGTIGIFEPPRPRDDSFYAGSFRDPASQNINLVAISTGHEYIHVTTGGYSGFLEYRRTRSITADQHHVKVALDFHRTSFVVFDDNHVMSLCRKVFGNVETDFPRSYNDNSQKTSTPLRQGQHTASAYYVKDDKLVRNRRWLHAQT